MKCLVLLALWGLVFVPVAIICSIENLIQKAKTMKFTFNPFAMWFKDPGVEDIKRKQLREALVGRAEHEINSEYHSAMTEMLNRRIARLQTDLGSNNYEAHITVSSKHSVEAGVIAKKYGWKTSEIARDPVLGDAVHFYLTAHSRDYAVMMGKMLTTADTLRDQGVEVLREKIEQIVYDTKTGVQQ